MRVSTDTTAEGLNLQQRCHHLIHLELPFNPNRLEQRNGRIDRFGQEHEPVVRYLFLRDTFEERILLRLIAKYERQRLLLTFVPNTLGVTASTDAAAGRLLKGLMDEDQKLFHDDTPKFDFSSADENEGTDEATRELLEEIDRSLKGFEQAARTNSWLGEVGLNAENRLLTQAEGAHDLGRRVSAVDLVSFVCDAVNLDGGDVRQTDNPDIFEVRLPPAWSYGLDELPGYDADTRLLRLTTNLDITGDEQRNSVGFLGRTHPLVRKALDRVRNLSYGGAAQQGQDPRASVVKADVPTPTLLFTYLGRVSSSAGRELERVLAVEINSEGVAKFHESADGWLFLADRQRAMKTTDVWKNHFQSWGKAAGQQARQTAQTEFLPVAEAFIREWRRDLEGERSSHYEWLRQRANEVIAYPVSLVEQLQLFSSTEKVATQTRTPSTWVSLSDPLERLAAFATDKSQPSRLRSEADGVLRIYRQRLAQLETRLSLGEPETTPLGVLMLVPEGDYGA